MYIFKLLASILTGSIIFLTSMAEAKPLTIIYVPLDNRPVNSSYVRQTMAAAGCHVVMPPENNIATNTTNGDPDKLWEWLVQKAPRADAAVISTDSLIYGGLVPSRTHNLPFSVLKKRIERLNELERTLPIKLYCFSTIMRTPRGSAGRVEPPYYEKYGPQIFAYSQWVDKADQRRLLFADQVEKQFAKQKVPHEYLEDWLQRREKNFRVNNELINLTMRNKFHFFTIGKDDNAILSHTHMEARKLNRKGFVFSKDKFSIIDGVDQLGLLLMARAYNEARSASPKIYPLYSEGVGAGTLPQYSDARFQDSVPQQIIASGSSVAANPAEADFILALNSPEDGIVRDTTAGSNRFFASPANKRYIDKLLHLAHSGHKISLADVSYSNGADNGFMHNFALAGGLEKLIAYNGWNTDDNAIGYAIAQGIMADATKPKDLKALIRQRLVDDWFYQSNARTHLSKHFENITREDLKYSLGEENNLTVSKASLYCNDLSERYSFTKGAKYKLTFPWDRLFEVNVEIKN